MEIKYFSPTELKDYENNAKLHPDSQIRLIIRNIESAGFYNPILISPDKTIIAGHGRRKAAIQAGLKEVPCIVLDVDTTTANKLRLMDNKSAESGYDLEKLVEELQTFSKAEIDDTGYSLSDLDRMLDDLGKISVIPSNGVGPGYFDDEPDESESDGEREDGDTKDFAYSESENVAVTQGGVTKEINPDDFEFEHRCPKCGFEYND